MAFKWGVTGSEINKNNMKGLNARMKTWAALCLLVLLGVTGACKSPQLEVDAFCWKNEMGNYSIRWEVSREMDGKVEVYKSFNPDSFPERPAQVVPLSEGMVDVIDRDHMRRTYFLLVFPDGQRIVVADIALKVPNVRNFCDLGGEDMPHGKRIPYGVIYRSGTLDSIIGAGPDIITQLKIKTVIDLRPSSYIFAKPKSASLGLATHSHPIVLAEVDSIVASIKNDDCKRDDAILFMQKSYHEALVKSADQIRATIELLADRKNYPLLLACIHGKDRSSIITALLYDFLGVDRWSIEQDYLITREVISLSKYRLLASQLSEEGQEALTVLLVPQLPVIRDFLKWIDVEYGSTYNYFHNYLGIDEEVLVQVKNNLTCQK